MPSELYGDLSLFLDILRTLEAIGARYVVVGAFAATVYGSTRATHDIDIIVDLSEEHIVALEAAYPAPRYYADPEQMLVLRYSTPPPGSLDEPYIDNQAELLGAQVAALWAALKQAARREALPGK